MKGSIIPQKCQKEELTKTFSAFSDDEISKTPNQLTLYNNKCNILVLEACCTQKIYFSSYT